MKELYNKLKEGKPLFGVNILGDSPVIIEDYANYRFDYFNLDLYHSELSLSTARELFLTGELAGISPVVTLQDKENHTISSALNMGAQIIVIPEIKNEEEARRAASAAKFPPFPNGKRKYNKGVRAAYFGGTDFKPDQYIKSSNERQLAFVLCDSEETLNRLDEVLSVNGIDGVKFDAINYMLSKDETEFEKIDYEREILDQALSKILEIAAKHQAFVMTDQPLATHDQVEKLLKKGCRLINIGSDIDDFKDEITKVKNSLVDPLLEIYAKG